jgi:hypothetical protein
LQETEEALEELRSKYRDTRGRMDAEVESLVSQVNALNATIEAVQVCSSAGKDKRHCLGVRTREAVQVVCSTAV